MMRPLLCCAVFTAGMLPLLRPWSAAAADAYFEPDGETVITIVEGTSFTGPSTRKTGPNEFTLIRSLAKVEIATGKAAPLPLPAEIQEIDSIARGVDGEVLILAKGGIWVFQEGKPVRKMVSTESVKDPRGLFVDTQKGSTQRGRMYVSGMEKETDGSSSREIFFSLRPGDKELTPVYCRRVEDAYGGVFAKDGRFFFLSSRDVWEGSINGANLTGARVAPLAHGNTDFANSGSLSVDEIQPAGGWLYCMLRGHHDLAFVRTPITPHPLYDGIRTTEPPELLAGYAAMAKALARTEIIPAPHEFYGGLCVTEVKGEPRVFYYQIRGGDKGPPLMLWTGSGSPKVIGHFPVSRD